MKEWWGVRVYFAFSRLQFRSEWWKTRSPAVVS